MDEARINGGTARVGDEVYIVEGCVGDSYRLNIGDVVAIHETRVGPLLRVQTGAAHQTTLRFGHECWKEAP